MADDRKVGRAEALAELANRIPPQIARSQGESFEVELRAALKRVGLGSLDPEVVSKLALAYRALLVIRAQRVAAVLAKEAVTALMESGAPLPAAEAASIANPPAVEGATETKPAGGSGPTNGQRGDPLCS